MAKNEKGYAVPDGFTADIIVVTEARKILMIERANFPYKGCLALPGGHVEHEERSYKTALRELFEETGVSVDRRDIKLLGVYDVPNRDPRGWYISHCYYTVPLPYVKPIKTKEAKSVKLVPFTSKFNNVAFDHQKMIFDYLKR